MNRYKYKIEDVSEITLGPPAFAAILWMEQKLVRNVLKTLPNLQSAAEIGSGYGRMTGVLREFCEKVDGWEREPEFVQMANSLYRDYIKFHNYETVSSLPIPSDSYDLIMTFTFLQHLHTEKEFIPALKELDRIVKSGGYLLLVEETDFNFPREGDNGNPFNHICIERSVEQYQNLLKNFTLEKTIKREYPVQERDTGTLMLFRKN